MIAINDYDFKRLTTFIKANYGINLVKKRTLIEGRLSNIIMEKGFKNFTDYLDYVFNDVCGKEMTTIINKLTTNHTYFMREAQHFEYFRDTVLPYLEKNVKGGDLRIWCAGCSSGEEPYTLEMILADYFGKLRGLWDTQVLATDISDRALTLAKNGEYSAAGMMDVPNLWKLNYFEKSADKPDTLRVKDNIKNKVIYRPFNLMTPVFPFRKKFQVIFCRNVMIYFDQQTKDDLVNKFYECTEPGGYLFIGHSESVNRENTKYQYIMPAVYRKL